MGLRSYIVNFRKNWVLKPSIWNQFFKNMELDLIDLNNEVEATDFIPTTFHTANETMNLDFGKDSKSSITGE